MRIPFKETMMTGVCVAILCGLGTWQVQRLHWKNDIIAGLEQSYKEGARADLSAHLKDIESGARDYAYGTIHGRFLKDKAVLLGPRVRDGRSGYNLLVPLQTDKHETIIVDTGWVSDMWNDTLDERLATLPLNVSVRGLAREPDYSSLTSKNSPENNLWFRADPQEIAVAKEIDTVSPALLFADSIDPPLQDVIANDEHWLPRNKHEQYAMFWYALAIVMLAVYGFYVRSYNRPDAGSTTNITA